MAHEAQDRDREKPGAPILAFREAQGARIGAWNDPTKERADYVVKFINYNCIFETHCMFTHLL